MKLYNTLTRSVEEFKPLHTDSVTFYQCGPTVYWVQHIGNLRAMTLADFIRRSLLLVGYKVSFVRNYTDVGHLVSDEDVGEDKMEKGAKREGLTPHAIADKYIKIFEEDTKALNILEPNFKPRATEFVNQMIAMVKTLLDTKHAYITEFAIYFDVSTFPTYNALNRQKIDFNKKGMGKGTADDPQKKHFADFAIWIFKKGAYEHALQTWSSPWGVGFPGWHLECSAMSKALLGTTIDIHMGGIEHIAVHHTNEIAQSESINKAKLANYWIHNEHLNVDDAKMAKSQGTGFTLEEIRSKGFNPLDLRYFFLQAHYRSKQNFTWEALMGAHEAYVHLKKTVLDLKKHAKGLIPSTLNVEKWKKKFFEDISNDIQTPQALALLWDTVKTNELSADEKLHLLFEYDRVFGLKLDEIQIDSIPEELRQLAKKRAEAKKQKDFKKADELRKQIEEKGYDIEDTKEGFELKKRP